VDEVRWVKPVRPGRRCGALHAGRKAVLASRPEVGITKFWST